MTVGVKTGKDSLEPTFQWFSCFLLPENIKIKKYILMNALLYIRLLQTAQGSLLDDEQLVNTLNSSKTTSQEVAEQLQVSEQTEIKIDAAREVMRAFINFEQ